MLCVTPRCPLLVFVVLLFLAVVSPVVVLVVVPVPVGIVVVAAAAPVHIPPLGRKFLVVICQRSVGMERELEEQEGERRSAFTPLVRLAQIQTLKYPIKTYFPPQHFWSGFFLFT